MVDVDDVEKREPLGEAVGKGTTPMKLKRLIALGLAAFTMVAFAAGCGSNTADQKAAGDQLPKKIIVGLDDNYPPMGFHDDKGNIVGFDIDMAKEAAKRANMDIEFKPIDWDSKEAELKSKHIDVLWNGLTVTPEREKNMSFSIPYLVDTTEIVVKKDSPIQSVNDLKGKIVGTQQGSSAETVLDKDPDTKQFKQLKKYGDFVSAFMDLEVGRIDALVVDSIVGQYNMAKKPGQFREVADPKFGKEDNAIGFRKEDNALREKFNGILKQMMEDGTADKIAQKWFGNTNMLDKSAFKN